MVALGRVVGRKGSCAVCVDVMVVQSGSWTVRGVWVGFVWWIGALEVRKWPVAPVSRIMGSARDNV